MADPLPPVTPVRMVRTMHEEPDDVSVTVSTSPDPSTLSAWDHLVSHTPGSDVAQLSAWAQVRGQCGFLPCYLLARRSGRVAGGALVLRRPLPVLGVLGYLPNGPVIEPGVGRAAVADALCTALADLATRQLTALFVQPPHGAHDISERLLRRGFRRSEAGIAPAASIKIDLTRETDDIRDGLSASNRRRTRTWADRGLTVRAGGAHDLPLLARLLSCTAAHQHFDAPSLDYLQTLYRALDPGGHVAVFIAELNGEAVAAELFTGCGGVLRSRFAGMQRNEATKKAGAAAAIIWHAIGWAKANRYHILDLGGIPAETVDLIRDRAPGFTSRLSGSVVFKASFGGQPYRYPPAVELLSSRLLRTGYDLLRRSPIGSKAVASAARFMRGGGRR
jgi:lipid II:glycine glycyltransferase (peptidoglycan interpeptide bridge formation enzyme)